ncbi:hypothetical protein [Actinoplanes aureus]|uniref:Uncharacterized protein n=1 Tax=Actinoplanes aureus TaxID=2792083 RepID=A0A931FZH8_9ACTN|nr:hypothetical protein [Actinoplanes aureus]MBG0565708.1 hypothetical protein [Actinoplanes aureus]
MTVQTPQEPGHYPTAPPWASPPAPVPEAPAEQLYGGLVAPYGDPENKHGQLLVRFPEEVHVEGRPEAPSWRPVVVLTFFFSLLGVVSAMRRAGKARRYGRNRAPYWLAFVVTLLAGAAFWSVLAVNVALPAYLNLRESANTKNLQSGILDDGRIEKALAAEVSDAGCTPEGDRGGDGLRTYLCTFDLSEGGKTSLYVRADERGNWELSE